MIRKILEIGLVLLVFLTGITFGYQKGYLAGSGMVASEATIDTAKPIYNCPNCGKRFTVKNVIIELGE